MHALEFLFFSGYRAIFYNSLTKSDYPQDALYFSIADQ